MACSKSFCMIPSHVLCVARGYVAPIFLDEVIARRKMVPAGVFQGLSVPISGGSPPILIDR